MCVCVCCGGGGAYETQVALDHAFQTLNVDGNGIIRKQLILSVFSKMRPHYNLSKLEVLYSAVDPDELELGGVRKEFFFRVLDALNLRVRSKAPKQEVESEPLPSPF